MANEPVTRPSPRRRAQRALSSTPLRLLRRIIEDRNPTALLAVRDEHLNEDEQPIYQFVRQHHNAHAQFPSIATLEERRINLPEAPEPLEYYRQELTNSIQIRQAADAMSRMREAIELNDGAEAVRVMREVEEIRTGGPRLMALRDVMGEVQANLNPATSMNRIVETGIPAFDELVGGIGLGDMGVIYGRPSSGKTMTQLSGVLRLAETGRQVVLVTREMSVSQIAHRLLILYTDLDPRLGTQLRVSSRAYAEIMDRFQNEVPQRIRDNIILPDPNTVRTTADVKAVIREVQPYLCAIDGTYFLEPASGRHYPSSRERLEQIIRDLKGVGEDTGQALLVTWQQNRSKGNGTDGLYGTDAISQDASLAIEIRKHPGSRDMRVATVTKNRHGPMDFEIGITFRFKPTDVGQVCDIPLLDTRGRRDDREATTRSERARNAAVRRQAAQRGTGEDEA